MTHPLIGAFPEVFDSSMIATSKSCLQKFKKSYIDQWKSKESSVHLHAGKAFADGIEAARRAYYEANESQEDATGLGVAALLASYGDFECPADSAKSAERMAGALEYYCEMYPFQPDEGAPIVLADGKRGIEINFVTPVDFKHPVTGNPILYCGRLDALCNIAGAPRKVDEKTTSSLGATWSRKWDLRSQFIGYEWGLRQMGIRTQGAVIRGVSILKTKYDTAQAVINHPDWMVDRWYEQLIEHLAMLQRCWETGKWHYAYDDACADFGGCGFTRACSVEDETPWLETYFERRHWDPILRKETLLT